MKTGPEPDFVARLTAPDKREVTIGSPKMSDRSVTYLELAKTISVKEGASVSVSVVMPFRGYENPSSCRTQSAPTLDSL